MATTYDIIPGDFGLFPFHSDLFKTGFNAFKCNIEEKEAEFEVTAHFPGVAKEDIEITFENDQLTISYAKKEETDESKQKRFVHRELTSFESASRSFAFPQHEIDEAGITAKLANGVLTVILPKRVEQPKEKSTISID